MKLELTDQQKMIQKMVREFAEKEVAPIASELDEKGEYPNKTLEKMAKLGLLGIIIPNEFGGAGLDTISYSIVVEEISRTLFANFAIVLYVSDVGVVRIEKF